MERINSDNSETCILWSTRDKEIFHITQDSSPWDIFEIFFRRKMFKFIQKETNQYPTGSPHGHQVEVYL
jgi:hypothetical protein